MLEGLSHFFKGFIFFLSSSDFFWLRASLTCLNGRFLWSDMTALKCAGIKLLYSFGWTYSIEMDTFLGFWVGQC